MPRDQPNEYAPGADNPTEIPETITQMRDSELFTRNIFDEQNQKAEKPNEIAIPRDTDVQNMTWRCHCGKENAPVRDFGIERIPSGGVSGLVQRPKCSHCQFSLIGKRETDRAHTQFVKQQQARNTSQSEGIAVPVAGGTDVTWTDVLMGKDKGKAKAGKRK